MKEKKPKEVKIKKTRNKRKFFIVGGFVLLLLVAGGLNIYLNSRATIDQTAGGTVVTAGNFFTRYRSDRDNTRSEEITYLDAIINNSSSSAEAVKTATEEKQALIKKMEMVLEVENVLKSKGFNDVAVSALSNNISVMVSSEGLTKAEVAQITDVILNYTDYTFDNINIIEV